MLFPVIMKMVKIGYRKSRGVATLKKINCGLFYGFSQVGKFLTVYPSDAEQAVKLAKILHNVTRRLSGPVVPYDLKYADGSLVHYRYGAFDSKLEIQSKDGNIPAISNPSGILVPDDRGPKYKSPDWIEDPFQKESGIYITGASKSTPLGDRVKAYKSLSQRGKGGVYRSLHLGFQPAIHCVLQSLF